MLPTDGIGNHHLQVRSFTCGGGEEQTRAAGICPRVGALRHAIPWHSFLETIRPKEAVKEIKFEPFPPGMPGILFNESPAEGLCPAQCGSYSSQV